jgi:hypothetical protein
VSGLPPAEGQGVPVKRKLALRMDEFAWEALQHESTRLKVSEEELIAFAVMYYLADVDSGSRTARGSSRWPGLRDLLQFRPLLDSEHVGQLAQRPQHLRPGVPERRLVAVRAVAERTHPGGHGRGDA